MSEFLREYEGTWEEVAAHETELRGHLVKLTVIDNDPMQQAVPVAGELPRGSYARITAGLRQRPFEADAEPDLWEIIAEERSAWRKMAQEKSE